MTNNDKHKKYKCALCWCPDDRNASGNASFRRWGPIRSWAFSLVPWPGWARSMARVEGNGLTSSCNAFWCWDAIKSTRWIMDLKSFAFWLGATGQSALHSAPTFVDGICINMFAPSKHNSDIDLGFAEFKRYDGCLWAFCSKVCNTCADRGPVFESGASVVKAVPSVSLCVSSN